MYIAEFACLRPWLYVCIILHLCSYNAFKFHTQGGDVNQQLSAVMHLLCASCAGECVLPWILDGVGLYTICVMHSKHKTL